MQLWNLGSGDDEEEDGSIDHAKMKESRSRNMSATIEMTQIVEHHHF